MMDAYSSLLCNGNSLPVVFIRFNPDAFKKNREKQHIKKKERYATIVDFITTYSTRNPFTVKYFFYDTVHDRPEIFLDSEYDEDFMKFVIH
jgi:hypothetical protein